MAEIGSGQRLPGGLYFISTPIGAARDITLRALDLLRDAEVIAAEDTRSLRHLMDIHGVALGGRPLLSYHDHNGERMRPRLLDALKDGKSVVYASEAGTPLVADPGYQLGAAAIAAGHPVTAAPGPSAALAALTVSGLPSDRFLFAGFAPNGSGPRRRWLADLKATPATLILYESPKRLKALLTDMAEVMGGDRRAVVCRELTKKFEEVLRGTVAELAAALADREVRGEIVVLIDRPGAMAATPADIEAALREALTCQSVKDAAATVAAATGAPRREVYQMALKLAAKD